MTSRAPIEIKFMLACYCSAEPHQQLGERQWNSAAGQQVLANLRAEELIGDDYRPTERGKAWVQFICATPLPIAAWTLPKREDGPVTVEDEVAG